MQTWWDFWAQVGKGEPFLSEEAQDRHICSWEKSLTTQNSVVSGGMRVAHGQKGILSGLSREVLCPCYSGV